MKGQKTVPVSVNSMRCEQTGTHIELLRLAVQVVQRPVRHPRPLHPLQQPPAPPRLLEVPREHPVELALDPVDAHAVGHEEVAREAVPLLAHAQAQAPLLDQPEVDPRRLVFALVVRVPAPLSVLAEMWREHDMARHVQQTRHLRGLERVRDRHRRVVVLPERCDARQREHTRRHHHRERELAEQRRLRCLHSALEPGSRITRVTGYIPCRETWSQQ